MATAPPLNCGVERAAIDRSAGRVTSRHSSHPVIRHLFGWKEASCLEGDNGAASYLSGCRVQSRAYWIIDGMPLIKCLHGCRCPGAVVDADGDVPEAGMGRLCGIWSNCRKNSMGHSPINMAAPNETRRTRRHSPCRLMVPSLGSARVERGVRRCIRAWLISQMSTPRRHVQ